MPIGLHRRFYRGLAGHGFTQFCTISMDSATDTGLVSVGCENAFLKRRYGKRKTRFWAYRRPLGS